MNPAGRNTWQLMFRLIKREASFQYTLPVALYAPSWVNGRTAATIHSQPEAQESVMGIKSVCEFPDHSLCPFWAKKEGEVRHRCVPLDRGYRVCHRISAGNAFSYPGHETWNRRNQRSEPSLSGETADDGFLPDCSIASRAA